MENDKRSLLFGDVGGTNVRIEYYLKSTDDKPSFEKKYKTNEFTKMEDLLERLKQEYDQFKPENTVSAISMASKIVNNSMRSTANYDWEWCDGNKVKEDYGKKSTTRSFPSDFSLLFGRF